jgi:hypothetical protein
MSEEAYGELEQYKDTLWGVHNMRLRGAATPSLEMGSQSLEQYRDTLWGVHNMRLRGAATPSLEMWSQGEGSLSEPMVWYGVFWLCWEGGIWDLSMAAHQIVKMKGADIWFTSWHVRVRPIRPAATWCENNDGKGQRK